MVSMENARTMGDGVVGQTVGGGFVIESLIGSGSFGSVFRAVRDGVRYAVKFSRVLEYRVYSAVGLVGRAPSPDLPLPTLVFYGTMDLDNHYVVMHDAGRTMSEMYDGMTSAELLFVAREIIRALEYLGCSQRVVHRDIKAENICVDAANRVKLVDLGSVARCKLFDVGVVDDVVSSDRTCMLSPYDGHFVRPCAPRYDTEMLALNIITWMCRTLPWEHLYARPRAMHTAHDWNARGMAAKRPYLVCANFAMYARKMDALIDDSLVLPKGLRRTDVDYAHVGTLCAMLLSCRHNAMPGYQAAIQFIDSTFNPARSINKPE